MKTIQVNLPDEYAAWLEARVAAGDWATLDEAVLSAVDAMKTEYEETEAILPGSRLHAMLTEGIESLDRGEGIDGEQFMAELIDRLSENAGPLGAVG